MLLGESLASTIKQLQIYTRGPNWASHSMTMNPSRGRPPLLSEANCRLAAREVRTGTIPTAVEVKCQLFPDVSVKTIRRALKGKGLGAYRRRQKFYLNHAAARRKWAKEHREWTVKDWKRVVYSDESKFNLHGSDGNRWVWRERGKGFDRRYMDAHEKYGGGSVMVWGCMTQFGFERLVRIQGKMDAEKYVSILEDGLLHTLDDHFLLPSNILFQQDNDRKHTSRRVTTGRSGSEINPTVHDELERG